MAITARYATRLYGEQADDLDLVKHLLRTLAEVDGWTVGEIWKVDIETIPDQFDGVEPATFASAALTVWRAPA